MSIEAVESLWDIHGYVSIEVDGERIPRIDPFGTYIAYFLHVCLISFSDPELDVAAKYEYEAPYEIEFAHDEGTMNIVLYSNEDSVVEAQLEVDVQTFAEEAIETSNAFLDYVLERREDLRDLKSTARFRSTVETAEDWHDETF